MRREQWSARGDQWTSYSSLLVGAAVWVQWKFVDANRSFVVDRRELEELYTFIGRSLGGGGVNRSGGAEVGWRTGYVQRLEIRHGG